MVDSYYANAAWPSVFLGWLCAVLVLRYGGSRVYRIAGCFFVGVIVGDILADQTNELIPGPLGIVERNASPLFVGGIGDDDHQPLGMLRQPVHVPSPGRVFPDPLRC